MEINKIVDLHIHLENLQPIFRKRSKAQGHLYSLEGHKIPGHKVLLSVAMYAQFYQSYNELLSLIQIFKKEVESLEGFKLIYNKEDLESNYDVGVILHIESARVFSNTTDQIDEVYSLGVRGIIPMHFINNKIGQSCDDPRRRVGLQRDDRGLSSFGTKFIEACHKKGMWLDLTHCTEQSASDILDISDKVMASHVGIQEISRKMRNAPLSRLKKIAAKNGVFGLIPWQHLIGASANAYQDSIRFAFEHGLEKAICIGSDFGSPIKTHPSNTSIFELQKRILDFPDFSQDMSWNNAYRFFENSLPEN